jgi:uncharacterized protein (TIGR02285 family)
MNILFKVILLTILLFYSTELLAQNKIKIMFFNRPPYIEFEENQMTGLIGTPVNKMLNSTKINYEYVNIPAKRQLIILKENKDKVCGLGWFKTEERETYAKFTEPIYKDSSIVALALSNNKKIGNVKFIKDILINKNIILLLKKGFSYGNYIDELIKIYNPEKDMVTCSNKSMLKMLYSSRADYFFISPEEAIYLIINAQKPFDLFRFIYFLDRPKGFKRYIMCSKSVDDEIIEKMNNWIKNNINIR